ncbi:MAG: NAD-dependent epimerase/dehydratase family protein [Elusimicrobia bacterium]|nr:NAD-dependent epimerase/dehydratase family protein [Elusimicrobiota bacterium]
MFYKGKNVLVTGSSGLIGSHLVLKLLEEGANIRASYHQKPPIVKNEKIQYLCGDLTKREDCQELVGGINFVFHCAANSFGAFITHKNPIAQITDNVLMNAQLLQAAHGAKVERFLYISSSVIYPSSQIPIQEEQGFTDDPYDIYFGVGWMKRYAEKLAQFYHRRYGLRVALVRPTNVYGPYDKFDPETSHVLPALIRKAIERTDPYEVWGDGSNVRDFVYVTDMVQALLLAMERAVDGKPVNFGSGIPITVKKSVELILKLTGYSNARVIFDPAKPTAIPTRLLDLTYSKKVLGFQAQVSFEDGLKKTIDWYRSTLTN